MADKPALSGSLGEPAFPCQQDRPQRRSPCPWLVAHAGHGDAVGQLAREVAQQVQAHGLPLLVLPLQEVTPELLLQTRRVLFILGEVRDGAEQEVLDALLDQRRVLSRLEYAVLGAAADPVKGHAGALLPRVECWMASQGSTRRLAAFDTVVAGDSHWRAALAEWLAPPAANEDAAPAQSGGMGLLARIAGLLRRIRR